MKKMKMTRKDEIKSIRMLKLLFRPLTKYLSPALKRFLSKQLGVRMVTSDDTQYLLYKLVDYNLQNVSNGSLNGMEKAYVLAVDKIIRHAIRGRNVVCHSVLPEVKAKSKSFITSWIKVAHLIGAKDVAVKLQETRKFLSNYTGKFPRVPSPAKRQRSMVSIFRALESDKKSNWSKAKEIAANAIEDALFDVIAEDFAMPMRNFMAINLKLIPYNSTVGGYVQLKFALAKCSPANFVAPEDGSVFDLSHIQTVMNSRHAVIHVQHRNTLPNWQKYFKSLIYVSLGIGATRSARMISRIYESLLAARKEARRQIKRARLLPPILRNRQHVFIKGETDRMNSRWLGRKNSGRKHLTKGPSSNGNQPGASRAQEV
ncbi:hypothetical protein DAPPUDRAFT_241655 [Daphnia pulex]|uniref:Uncharacterized protein n=1 Tax=Daphnia pulex TaxID=6669 RepID=E9GER6_DAPPU|nr:hypothetical protein DAPPUDRAFT_241655 [Daphnia pulex]|eukprot:EFX81882.1 hypothetical protein DAPPUDRAFT_241655 [Daphnia pulex]